jgi:hypothetical protein
MADNDMVVVNGGSRVGWFLAGALFAAAIVAGFLYADGYFDRSASIELKVDTSKIEIPPE